MKTYTDIITSTRRRKTSRAGRTLTEEAESDRARLLFSSPFRRLQQKAQVFSLEDNAAVRSRLTHSFEVSQNGRYMAQRVLAIFRRNNKLKTLGLDNTGSAFVTMVETACLMHDIGNPPFGHLGEQAIRDWFKHCGRECFMKSLGNKAYDQIDNYNKYMLPDFLEFDGNAQGFRIITKLQWSIDEYGFNLTLSQLAAFMKYLRAPFEREIKKDNFSRKPGYFFSEKEIADEVRDMFKLSEIQRYPLTYLMEAADDVAYCISDIEDALEKKLFDEEYFKLEVSKIWKSLLVNYKKANKHYLKQSLEKIWKKPTNIDMSRFFIFKTQITAELVNMAASNYVKKHVDIMTGTAEPLLEDEGTGALLLSSLKQFAREHIYNHPIAEGIELAGYQIIKGLLDHYRPLLESDVARIDKVYACAKTDHTGDSTDLEYRLCNRLPSKYKRVYEHAKKISVKSSNYESIEWHARAHLITDYVSGMTDRYALGNYQLLSGISIHNDAH